MKKIIILFLLAFSVLIADPYQPLTPEEAGAYLDTATREEIIQDIIKLDTLEHSTPAVSIGDLIVLYTKTDLVIYFTAPMTVEIPGGLSYTLTLPEYRRERIDKSEPWKIGTYFGAAGTLIFAVLYLTK